MYIHSLMLECALEIPKCGACLCHDRVKLFTNREPICVPVEETVIGYMEVTITKIHENPTSPTRGPSQV